MMGGLAYMTGPPGQPLRAGSSVNDIMGGLFAVDRASWPRCASASGPAAAAWCSPACSRPTWCWWRQHMARAAIEGRDPPPFGDPNMVKPWPLYDIFETRRRGRSRSSSAWSPRRSGAPSARRSTSGPAGRPGPRRHAPSSRRRAAAHPAARRRGVPQAAQGRADGALRGARPALRPDRQAGATCSTTRTCSPPAACCRWTCRAPRRVRRPGARSDAGLPGLPVSLLGGRPGLRRQPPRAGEHGAEIAREAGLSDAEIAALVADGTLSTPDRAATGAASPTPERAAVAVAAAE